jgi:hypothetical protein
MTDSATFTTSEADDEQTGEDLGDLLLEVFLVTAALINRCKSKTIRH